MPRPRVKTPQEISRELKAEQDRLRDSYYLRHPELEGGRLATEFEKLMDQQETKEEDAA